MKKLGLLIVLGCFALSTSAQKRLVESQKVTEGLDITVKKNALGSVEAFVIKNINGDLKVTGYDGDEIKVTGTKIIRKKRGGLEQKEIDEIYLQQEMHQNKLYMYVQAPGVDVEFRDGKMRHNVNWNRNRWDDKDRIYYEFNIEVMMPRKMMVKASTINGGDLVITEMMNGVDAGNVNGSVYLKEVAGKTHAHTVNGDIDVTFAESPTEDSRFNTVNGSMEIYAPADLSAVVTFESLHGDLYTDFEQVKRLKPELNKEKDGKGYRYRVGENTPVQIGDGGARMEFETVNGSAYIRKRK